QDGDARMHPGRETTPSWTGSANTIPSDATLRNINQNNVFPTIAGSDAPAGCETRLYCSAVIARHLRRRRHARSRAARLSSRATAPCRVELSARSAKEGDAVAGT